MTFNSGRCFVCVIWTALVLTLGGCVRTSVDKRYYILGAVRPGESAAVQTDTVLEVRRFTIDAAFADQGLVYRRDEFVYESDFYRAFLVAPAVMVTEKTRLWLARSGMFERVLTPGSRLEATHTLEGNITMLYGDLSDASAPKAVMELHCFLIANDDPDETVVLHRVYGASNPLESQSTDALVEALDRCLVHILARLEKDLGQSLSRETG